MVERCPGGREFLLRLQEAFSFHTALLGAVLARHADPCPPQQMRERGDMKLWQLCQCSLCCLPAAAPVAQPRVPISGHPPALSHYSTPFLLLLHVCSLLHPGSPGPSVTAKLQVWGLGRQRKGGGCLQVPDAELSMQLSMASPGDTAGTCTPCCLVTPGLLSEVATALCCHGVF